MVKTKVKEWLKRYLPSEIVGTITALSAASLTHFFSSNLIVIAYAGSLGEAIGFYSTVFTQHIIRANKKNRDQQKAFSFAELIKIIGTIALEFGPAGLLDGLVLRPFFMFIFPGILKNFTIGILVGKLVGDITFYLLVIMSYEIKKHRDKKNIITRGTEN
jgi:amino acid transporter